MTTMKRAVCFILLLCLCVSALMGSAALAAERTAKEKDSKYYGAMRVVRCKEWVSMRTGPRKTFERIIKVPLGAIVQNCRYEKKGFVKCEYQGEEGYIMLKYLEAAPEYEPAETTGESRLMTREEILKDAKETLNWKEFNVSILASHQVVTENKQIKEVLKVGCFIDDTPTWGYVETVDSSEDKTKLRAFMGGNIDEPQVMIYDSEYGLFMIDLLSGRETWILPVAVCNLGDGAATALSEDGILYIAGSEGPSPVAISEDGRVLWQSALELDGIIRSIELKPDVIELHYETGDGQKKTAVLEYSGDLIRKE